MAASAEKSSLPEAYSKASARDIAMFAHECICNLRRAMRDDSRITPWGMLSAPMQELLVKCVAQIQINPDLPLVALMNGFFRNHAKINGRPIPEKRLHLDQFDYDQILSMNCFLQACRVALFEPKDSQ